MVSSPHDPGADAAAATFDGSGDVAANPFDAPNGGTIRIGTASWTDPTMTAAGVFYPAGADSAEERLRYYASRFPLVEVDATYYSLPAAERPSCGSNGRRPTSRSTSRRTR